MFELMKKILQKKNVSQISRLRYPANVYYSFVISNSLLPFYRLCLEESVTLKLRILQERISEFAPSMLRALNLTSELGVFILIFKVVKTTENVNLLEKFFA